MKRVAISDVLTSASSTSIAVAGVGTAVYTKAFKLAFAEYFSLFYKAASSGTVNVKIELEESWTLPAVEGEEDDNWVVPEGASIIDTLTDETQHCKTLSPIVAEYGRFKITGLTDNDDSTILRIRRGFQEEY